MLKSPLAQSLFDQIAAMPTVDAHEHLHAEEKRLGRKVDIFLLFHQYLFTKLIAVGMDEAKAAALESEEVSPDDKLATLAPCLDRVRTCSAARPPFEALRRFFGEEDLTPANYLRLTDRIREHSRPGLFDRCLREACNIVLVLNQNRTMWQNDLFRPILPEDDFMAGPDREALGSRAAAADVPVPATLAAFVELMYRRLEEHVRQGMIGIKGCCFAYAPADRDRATAAYARLLGGRADGNDHAALSNHLRELLYERCGVLGIVVVKHSGVWSGGWSDHTNIRPTEIIPVAIRHCKTRFDLFHAATPWAADAGIMGRALPNVWINLCWSHLLSPTLSEQALDMWLDMIPANKVIGFGGDYWWAVENVYGALQQAREIAANVLARRVRCGGLTEHRALAIARGWFHDNARELYRV
jgi:predicted TIM-barrel fold metal-dependent hydrolase